MISVKEALKLVVNSSIQTKIINIKLIDSVNCFLSEDIYSPINMPPFSQSAMDGYAISGSGNLFKVVGEIKAGDVHHLTINNGEAYRIFTGGMIPTGTTSIAKQEIVNRIEDNIELLENVKDGTSIRKEGEEIKKNELVLSKGSKLTPAAIGLLTSLGFSHVKVFKKPNVSVIVTGNELAKVGDTLEKGKIYESNSFTIKSALYNVGVGCDLYFVKDNFEATKSTIEDAMASSDVLILTGGISVGDYDFVGKALQTLNVKQKFYKVKQKPGKPLYYGEINQTKIFGLPGNPAAALTSFYVYVLTAIKSIMGANQPELLKLTAKISHDYTKKGDRAQFLKAQINGNEVKVLNNQSSAMLSSFAKANSLVFLDETDNHIEKGTEVDVFILP